MLSVSGEKTFDFGLQAVKDHIAVTALHQIEVLDSSPPT